MRFLFHQQYILIEKNNLNETLTKERETTSKQLETLGKVDAFKTSVTANMGEYSQMIEKQQKFIDKFPKNAIYMRWNYQKSETYGNQKAMKWYINNGLKVMGATAGQTRWTLMPQNQSNIPQIKSFALSSIEKKLDGLLLTLWDDDSPHFELYKRGITAFSNYTWSGKSKNIDEFKQMFRHRMYGKEFREDKFGFIDKLEKPVGNWLNLLLKDNVRRAEIAKSTNPLDLFIIPLEILNL